MTATKSDNTVVTVDLCRRSSSACTSNDKALEFAMFLGSGFIIRQATILIKVKDQASEIEGARHEIDGP